MFGLGLLAAIALCAMALFWTSARFKSRRLRIGFLLLVGSGLGFYPLAYTFSTSFASFKALCEVPDRYQVVQTKQVDYLYLNRDEGIECAAGPAIIGALPYAGFDCSGPTSRTTTGPFRYTKKPDWHDGCGLACFELTTGLRPEVEYRRSYRQGYITGTERSLHYGDGRTNTPSEEKLRFFDTVIVDTGAEMAYTRSYTYYPYGSGWATLLGAASGSAPSMRCKGNDIRWNVLDVYKPRAAS